MSALGLQAEEAALTGSSSSGGGSSKNKVDKTKFEFPAKDLTMGQKLGEGNFGIVFAGVAKGILDSGLIWTAFPAFIWRYPPPPPTRAAYCARISAHLCSKLIGACNPMLCPSLIQCCFHRKKG